MNWSGSQTFDPEEGAAETGAKLDFAIDWPKSARAEARSGVEVVPGYRRGIRVPSGITGQSLFAVSCIFWLVDRVGLGVQISELVKRVEGINYFLNGGGCSIQDRRVSVTGLIHVRQDTSSLGVVGSSRFWGQGHTSRHPELESEILL